MTETTDPRDRITQARTSFTGKMLTDGQFEESWALAGVMERSIRTSGSFVEKLGDYSHAFARAEKFDAVKGETIIRDIFKERYGLSMNQMREGLLSREKEIKDTIREPAIEHARNLEPLIRDGETMPFYRAFDHESAKMAKTFGITQAGAKTMMKESYKEIEGRDLYETGKSLEEKYHLPKREADKQAREELKQTRSR
ncbi:MAG: hypothetical protein ACR2RE_28015 [Geminicoccaceae bacterium]